MYLGGNVEDYHFLQGVMTTPSGGINPYPGLSTNQAWVNNFQNPFNNNVLTPAAALGQTDPAAAYAKLAPAFAQIQSDAVAFVNSYPPSMQPAAQTTINGWKKDFPLIQSFLDRWAPYASQSSAIIAAPAGGGTQQPTTIFQDTAPAPDVYGPGTAVYAPNRSGGTAPTYYPSSSPAVNVTTAAPAGDLSSTMSEYLPWIVGAAALGLLISAGGKRAAK